LHFDQEEKPENIASCKKDDFLLYYTLKKKNDAFEAYKRYPPWSASKSIYESRSA
jgi:hypothetical protein